MKGPYILESKMHIINDWISAKIGTTIVFLISFCVRMILGTCGLQMSYNGQYFHQTMAVVFYWTIISVNFCSHQKST